MVASVPLVPTFVRARAAKGYERRNRDTSLPPSSLQGDGVRRFFRTALHTAHCRNSVIVDCPAARYKLAREQGVRVNPGTGKRCVRRRKTATPLCRKRLIGPPTKSHS